MKISARSLRGVPLTRNQSDCGLHDARLIADLVIRNGQCIPFWVESWFPGRYADDRRHPAVVVAGLQGGGAGVDDRILHPRTACSEARKSVSSPVLFLLIAAQIPRCGCAMSGIASWPLSSGLVSVSQVTGHRDARSLELLQRHLQNSNACGPSTGPSRSVGRHRGASLVRLGMSFGSNLRSAKSSRAACNPVSSDISARSNGGICPLLAINCARNCCGSPGTNSPWRPSLP